MKKFMSYLFLGLMTLSTAALADENLSFKIDWNNPQSLNQGESIDCQDRDTAAVVITVGGVLSRDFKVTGPGGSCRIVDQRRDKITHSTTVVFRGEDCFGDGDAGFFVNQIGTDKEAQLTAVSGC